MKERLATAAVYLVFFAIAWAILYVWSSYGLQMVEGEEMSPALKREKLQWTGVPSHGDEGFRHGDMVSYVLAGTEGPSRTAFAGRIIGLPGDMVKMENGTVFLNGKELAEPYVMPKLRGDDSRDEILVPRGCVYILYDNRAARFEYQGRNYLPIDSRAFGPIGVWAITEKF